MHRFHIAFDEFQLGQHQCNGGQTRWGKTSRFHDLRRGPLAALPAGFKTSLLQIAQGDMALGDRIGIPGLGGQQCIQALLQRGVSTSVPIMQHGHAHEEKRFAAHRKIARPRRLDERVQSSHVAAAFRMHVRKHVPVEPRVQDDLVEPVLAVMAIMDALKIGFQIGQFSIGDFIFARHDLGGDEMQPDARISAAPGWLQQGQPGACMGDLAERDEPPGRPINHIHGERLVPTLQGMQRRFRQCAFIQLPVADPPVCRGQDRLAERHRPLAQAHTEKPAIAPPARRVWNRLEVHPAFDQREEIARPGDFLKQPGIDLVRQGAEAKQVLVDRQVGGAQDIAVILAHRLWDVLGQIGCIALGVQQHRARNPAIAHPVQLVQPRGVDRHALITAHQHCAQIVVRTAQVAGPPDDAPLVRHEPRKPEARIGACRQQDTRLAARVLQPVSQTLQASPVRVRCDIGDQQVRSGNIVRHKLARCTGPDAGLGTHCRHEGQ